MRVSEEETRRIKALLWKIANMAPSETGGDASPQVEAIEVLNSMMIEEDRAEMIRLRVAN